MKIKLLVKVDLTVLAHSCYEKELVNQEKQEGVIKRQCSVLQLELDSEMRGKQNNRGRTEDWLSSMWVSPITLCFTLFGGGVNRGSAVPLARSQNMWFHSVDVHRASGSLYHVNSLQWRETVRGCWRYMHFSFPRSLYGHLRGSKSRCLKRK